MALVSPNTFKLLKKWLYKLGNLNSSLPVFPKGLYIIWMDMEEWEKDL